MLKLHVFPDWDISCGNLASSYYFWQSCLVTETSLDAHSINVLHYVLQTPVVPQNEKLFQMPQLSISSACLMGHIMGLLNIYIYIQVCLGESPRCGQGFSAKLRHQRTHYQCVYDMEMTWLISQICLIGQTMPDVYLQLYAQNRHLSCDGALE